MKGKKLHLQELGYDSEFEENRIGRGLGSLGIGRVISEHKDRYIVKTDQNEFESEVIGNLRYAAKSRADFPAVGDWVAIMEYDELKALIHAILPRKTIIERQAVGKVGDKQIIATNIDYAFIMQAVDRDFNINRIERYLTICNTARVKPIIIINKIDLINESQLEKLLQQINERVKHVPIVSISNESKEGFIDLRKYIMRGKTYCLLGSSGVGKSTLTNRLSGQHVMNTNIISSSNYKGRHITSHRELVILENGGILIDNPGMREVGIADSAGGLEITFDEIFEIAKSCKFKNCTHLHEKGCAVIEALENEEIDNASYENYQKMEKEKAHFDATVAEKRKRDKDFGKMVKRMKKDKKSNKY